MNNKISVPSEHEEQRNFVKWFRLQYPRVRIIAIPNGGARSIVTAGRLKLEGVSPGVPDLFIPEWGLWIEMKRSKGGTISSAQSDWIDYLQCIGHTVKVARGFDDAMQFVTEHFYPR